MVDLQKSTNDESTEPQDRVPKASSGAVDDVQQRPRKRSQGTGARIHHDYQDRTEPTVGVTRDDLAEMRNLGTFQQLLFGIGSFLFSGAFWLVVTMLIEHVGHYSDYTNGFLVCAVAMLSGGALTFVGWRMFQMKQKRLDKYFPKDSD